MEEQKSAKFAAQIVGNNIPEEIKVEIAEEIQATVLRHLARIDRGASGKSICN